VTNIVLLNNVDHADLAVARGYGAAFGDAVNQALVFPTEFEALQREYVILFRQDGQGALQSVAILGLDRDENLYLDGDAWRARHVPAIQRRGPFSIGLRRAEGSDAPPDLKINIDLDHPRVTAGGGEPVFRRHGGATPYLDDVSRALSTIYDGLEMTAPMFQAFAEAGLIEPVAIDITVGEARRYDLPDFFTIRRERLDALDGAALERLHRAGWLAAAFQVASSLGNIERLVEMKNRKEGWS
jgi:hypothetical protein